MKLSPLIVAASLFLLSNAASAQSIYKCTNPDGSVSFQDRACPESASSKTMDVEGRTPKKQSGYDGEVVSLPGIGEVAFVVFDYMETIVKEDGERSTTVGIRSRRGAPHKMSNDDDISCRIFGARCRPGASRRIQ